VKKRGVFKLIVLCALLSLVMLLTCVKKSDKIAYAGENESWSILGQNLSGISEAEWSIFTPINIATGVRLGDESSSYRAYFPSLNSSTAIDGTTIHYFDHNINVTLLDLSNLCLPYENAAIDFWVYLENVSGHNFTITLEFENDKTIDIDFLYAELINNIQDDRNDGTGYVHLRHFLSQTNVENIDDVYDNVEGKFYKINRVRIYQKPLNKSVKEGNIGIFNLSIVNAQKMQNSTQIIEKQPYICYFFNFSAFYDGLKNENYVGDVWNIPNLTLQPTAYFWYGKQNLIASLYVVVNNNSSKAIKVGENYVFDRSGRCEFVVAAKTANNEWLYIQESLKVVNGFDFIGISLPYTKLTGVVNNKYVVSYVLNSEFDAVKDLQILSKNDIIEVENVDAEHCNFTIKLIKSGNDEIKIICNGVRNGAEKEYYAVIQVVSNTAEGRNVWLIVSTIICLGFALIVGLVFGIKRIKNANKYNVK